MDSSAEDTKTGCLTITDLQSARAVDLARRSFQRTLAAWTGDMLELRRCNRLLKPWDSTPTLGTQQASAIFVPMRDAA